MKSLKIAGNTFYFNIDEASHVSMNKIMRVQELNKINPKDIEIYFDKDLDVLSRDKIYILCRELANDGYNVDVFIKQDNNTEVGLSEYFLKKYC